MHSHGRISVMAIPEALAHTHSFSTTASGSCPALPSRIKQLRTILNVGTIRRVLPPFDDNAGFGAMIMCSRASARRRACRSTRPTKSSHSAARTTMTASAHITLEYHDDGVRPSPYISEEAMAALWKEIESVLEQAGGVFSDGWELELWRITGRI